MASEIERRRKIDAVLSPPIKKANILASQLKAKSDALKIEIAKTEELVKLSKLRAQAAKKSASKKTIASPKISPFKTKFK